MATARTEKDAIQKKQITEMKIVSFFGAIHSRKERIQKRRKELKEIKIMEQI
jgi:hypothetical protein